MSLPGHQWFFGLIERCGTTPADRLAGLFGVVESLIQSPEIRHKLAGEFPSENHCLYAADELRDFLAALAKRAGAADARALAHQLAILLQGALAEELRNPDTGALRAAAGMARLMVEKSGRTATRAFAWNAAGGGMALLLVAFAGWQTLRESAAPTVPAAVPAAQHRMQAALRPMPVGISPDEIDAVLALHEKIEAGVCRAPHLLVLPPGQMTAYMDVVEFRTPADPAADRKNIREFLAWFDKIKSTECYEPPMNGHTTVKWTKG